MNREYKQWNFEKRLIPEMIRMYCRGNHKESRKEEGVKGKELCLKCKELAEYAAFRLEKCPFKKNKGFCSFCIIHCYCESDKVMYSVIHTEKEMWLKSLGLDENKIIGDRKK